MGKSALIIGGTGFLGTAVCEELLRAGWEVAVLSRGKKMMAIPGVDTIVANRSDPQQLSKAIHGRSFELVVDCVCHNPIDAAAAVDAFSGGCGHYVFISTDFVYASDSRSTYPLTEDSLIYRDTDYACGKLDAEQSFLHAWRERRFPVTVLRPSHIVGKGQRPGSDQALGRAANLLELIRAGRGLQLLAEGQLLIQPVWHREIGRCIAHMAGAAAGIGQLFNCAGPACVTNERYYQIIADILQVPLLFESVSLQRFLQQKPGAKHYARHRIYDTSRLTQATGYTPHLKLEEALEETVEWVLQTTV